MALLHEATISPRKDELIEPWLRTRPWWDGVGERGRVAAFRLDDPAGHVGIECFLFGAASNLDGGPEPEGAPDAEERSTLFVPVTYRGARLPGADSALMRRPGALRPGHALRVRRLHRPGLRRHGARCDPFRWPTGGPPDAEGRRHRDGPRTRCHRSRRGRGDGARARPRARRVPHRTPRTAPRSRAPTGSSPSCAVSAGRPRGPRCSAASSAAASSGSRSCPAERCPTRSAGGRRGDGRQSGQPAVRRPRRRLGACVGRRAAEGPAPGDVDD